ncbi:MAG: HEAT repeat domain-containing protein [Bryobacteraceae bacterium]
MTSDQQKNLENKTTEELFHATLEGDWEDETAWDAVHVLRLRGTEDVFHLAVIYCRSAVPVERGRGLNVLAQLGAGKPQSQRPHVEESVAIAIEHLCDEDPTVVDAAAWALAHLGGDKAISALISLRKSLDPDIRWAVANGLNGSERADAIATIIELLDDLDDKVRVWATFALGTQWQVDSPEIRDALRKRLNDSYEMARNEAVWGLAQRKDPQGIRMLVERLSADEWMPGDEMAAAETLGVPYNTPAEELRGGLQMLLDA